MNAPAATRFVFSIVVVQLLTVGMQARVWAQHEGSADDAVPFDGLIVDPDGVTPANVGAWKKEGFDAVVLVLDERFEAAVYQKAAKAIAANGLDIYYWVEVGRNPTFAGDHPEWMASLGSHDDWRKRFPDVRKLQAGEVAKAWPWTPIAYRKAFDAHLARIKDLLGRIPAEYRGVLLNDLQGGPSSCGCGNLQCRWAIDYGVPATAEKIAGHDVAAKFLSAVSQLAPGKDVIPVWTTECEQEDMALEKQPKHAWTTGYCGSVDCLDYCRDRFNEQWIALHAKHHGPTAVLSLHKEFQRSRTEYGPPANWITHPLRYVDQKKVKSVPRHQLWLVIQGFDVTRKEEQAAREAASETGVGAVLVARARVDQSYEPRVMKSKPE
jgi:hypothetical protein